MIGSIKGIVELVSGSTMVVDVQGVGYEIQASQACLAQAVVGNKISLIIFTDLKEDSLKLFGFVDQLEKQVFLLLTMVKGIGTKSAKEIISKVDKLQLLRIIAAADSQELQKVRGIGKKTAERIILELKEKVGEYILQGAERSRGVEYEVIADSATEAIQALQALGFVRREAERLVNAVASQHKLATLASSEVVRMALRMI